MLLRKVLAPAAAVLVGGLSFVGTAQAADRGEITISPTSGVQTHSYPAIPGVRPNACEAPSGCGATPYAQTQYPGCQTNNSAYCDAIKLNIDKPAGYPDDLYFVNLELTWDRGATDNKLDLYVFSAPHPVFGPSLVDNRRDENPKLLRIFAPEGGSLYMTVVNERGVNSGYTLKAEWDEVTLDPRVEPRRPSTGPTTPSSGGPGSTAASGSWSPGADAEGDVTARGGRGREALVPGADGELRQVALPSVAAGQREPVARGSRFDPVVGSLVMGFLVAGAGFGFWLVRRREIA